MTGWIRKVFGRVGKNSAAVPENGRTLQRDALHGDPIALNNLGWAYYKGSGVPLNYAEAVTLWRRLAEQEDATARSQSWEESSLSDDAKPDFAEGARILNAANAQQSARHGLGCAYRYGKGVPQDIPEAVRWLRKAATSGHVGAQFDLGIMYMEGEGVPQDPAEGFRWYRMAADYHAPAQFQVGQAYYFGRGVMQDKAKAFIWFNKAAAPRPLLEYRGSAGAQFALGIMYATGDSVPESTTEAIKWLTRAAEQGDAAARDALKELREE